MGKHEVARHASIIFLPMGSPEGAFAATFVLAGVANMLCHQ